MGACSVWPVTNVPEFFFEPVVSDIPLLLVVGGRDHTTPVEYSAAIAKGFRNSKALADWHGLCTKICS